MKTVRRGATFGLVLILAALVGVAGVAQSQRHGQQARSQEPEREVFCSHLSSGQLCLSGAPNILKLDGTKKEQWLAAAREYNKSVGASTKQLLAQAKAILSPEEYATMEKWFDKGLNEVLNGVLIGNQAARQNTNTSHK